MKGARRADRSPRKRGCFSPRQDLAHGPPPIPAQAGVFPRAGRRAASARADPRASGGVSRVKSGEFAPRQPIPAQAGVFPPQSSRGCSAVADPRASGGVSIIDGLDLLDGNRSPRKRGCFQFGRRPLSERRPIPAQAGVFPHWRGRPSRRRTDPRASGGVSEIVQGPLK